MNGFIQLVQSIIRTLFEFFHFGLDMIQPKPRDPILKAEFEKDQQLFSIFHEGFCLDGKRSMSLKDSFRHAIIVGKSGVGKSTATFISSLLTMPTSGSSFVIHDPSKELFSICSGYLKAQGYSVLVLDFSDPKRSIGFNPLEKSKENDSHINMIAGMLVKTTLKSADPFWDTSAQELIATTERLVLRMPPKFHTLPNTLHIIKMISGDRKRFNEIAAKHSDSKLHLEICAFLANDPKVISGIIATAIAAMSIFADEKVAQITSHDTFSFNTPRKRKVALFVQNSVSSLSYYNPIISIFFEMYFASLLHEVPKDSDKSIYLLLDEFASGLILPSYSNCISHFRKYRVGCLMGIQSFEQLRIAYQADAATNIVSNCHVQMYFSEQSHSTAKLLQDMLGKYNFSDDKGNNHLVRNLMEADEIRMLGKNKAIIIVGSEKPILATLTPFYDRIWLKLRANLKVPYLIGVGVNTSVPYVT